MVGQRNVLLLLVVAACGAELGEPEPIGGGGGKGDGDGLTATRFLHEIGEQFCDECFRCKDDYPDGRRAFEDDFGEDERDCVDDTNAFYQPALVEQSIVAGRVKYNAQTAQLCLAGITYERSCSAFWQTSPQFPATCDATLVGTITDGAACVSIFDCANPASICDATTKKCVRP